MKRFVLCSLLVFIGIMAMAQSTQPCIVQRYNQRNAKTPLEGVELIVNGAGSVISDDSGKLTLVFNTLKPGAKVELVRAYKAGFEVFNTSDVEQWNISLDQRPFYLVMADSKFLSNYKAKLRQTSEDSYLAKYHQALAEIATLKNNGRLKEEEYNRRLNEITQNYQTSLTHLEGYINQFAHFDLSAVTEEEQRILEMVEKGKIDEAVKAYEAMNISGKLRQAIEKKAAITRAKTQLEKNESILTQTIEELKEKQKREIATLKLAGGKDNFDKTGRILRDNALTDTTDIDSAWEYAQFALDQKQFSESERFLLLCLRIADNDVIRANVLNSLGNVYMEVKDYSKAERYYLMSLDEWTRLSELFPDAFLPDLSRVQHNIGVFCAEKRYYDSAQDFLVEALGNRAILCLQDPNTYRADAANTQNTLGTLYLDIKNYPEAHLYLRMALNNYSKLVEENPSVVNRKALADVQMNLGNVLSETGELSEAEGFYLKSLETYDQLFSYNPDAFRSALMGAQLNAGLFYRRIHNNVLAEDYLLKALKNAEALFKILPNSFRPSLALAQDDIGVLYVEIQRFDEAETFLQKSIENYGQLFQKEPDAYVEDMGMTHYHAGVLYTNNCDYAKAVKYFQKALAYYSQSEYSSVVHPEISEIINCLLRACVSLRDMEKYDEVLAETLSLIERMYESDPSYKDLVVELRKRKGHRFLLKGDTDSALSLFESAFSLDSVSSSRYLAEGLHAKACEYAQGWKYKEALEVIDRAIALDPEEADYYEMKGSMLYMTRDEQGAVAMWKKVLEIFPEYLEWHDGTCPLYELLKAGGLLPK